MERLEVSGAPRWFVRAGRGEELVATASDAEAWERAAALWVAHGSVEVVAVFADLDRFRATVNESADGWAVMDCTGAGRRARAEVWGSLSLWTTWASLFAMFGGWGVTAHGELVMERAGGRDGKA